MTKNILTASLFDFKSKHYYAMAVLASYNEYRLVQRFHNSQWKRIIFEKCPRNKNVHFRNWENLFVRLKSLQWENSRQQSLFCLRSKLSFFVKRKTVKSRFYGSKITSRNEFVVFEWWGRNDFQVLGKFEKSRFEKQGF